MPRADILRFFEREYYSRISGGQARLRLRILYESGRHIAKRVSRRLRKLTTASKIAPRAAS
jgi:hypothetical protein